MLKRQNRSQSKGFTLVELLVVIGIIALLISILLPSLSKAREAANKVKCGSNLKQIGQGLLLYANENNGNYPRTYYSNTAATATCIYDTTGNKTTPFATGASPVGTNNVMAGVFLLLRTQDLTAAVFVCPSSNSEADSFKVGSPAGNVQNQCNFSGSQTQRPWDNCSYSFQPQYPGTTAVNDGFRWTNTLKSDYAIAADLNPGSKNSANGVTIQTVTSTSSSKDQQVANSQNHQKGGQEVLYGDGHVEFQQTAFCGVNQDNIYTQGNVRGANGSIPAGSVKAPDGAASGSTGPNSKDDTILYPALY